MTSFRKLTKDEIVAISNRLKYEDQLDLPAIREAIKQLFGPAAHRVVLDYQCEYNDEGYDLQPTTIKVYNSNDKKIKPLDPQQWEDNDEWEFRSDFEIPDVGSSQEMGEITVFINEAKTLEVADLFVAE